MLLPAHVELSDGPDLRLRRHCEDDLDGIVELCSDPESQRWTTLPTPYDDAQAAAFVQMARTAWDEGVTAFLAIEVDGRFAGTVDLRLRELGWAETGFAVHPAFRGRHVMQRALRLLLDWGFDDLGLLGVRWTAFVGNDASRRVAEACGFRIEGTLRQAGVWRGERRDEWTGSVLPHERTGAR